MAQSNTNLMGSVGSTLGMLGSASTLTGLGGTALMTNPIGWGIAALGVGTALFGAGSEQKEAQEKLEIIKQQEQDLESAQKDVAALGQIRKEIVTEAGTRQYEQMGRGTGRTLGQITGTKEKAYQKTGGLAFAGGVEEETRRAKEIAREEHEMGTESLYAKVGSELLGIETDVSTQLGGIREKLAAVGLEKKQVGKAAGSYLYNLMT